MVDQIQRELDELQPDLIVLTGDTVVPQYLPRVGQILTDLLGTQIPIVATLGNHEFWGRTFEEALNCLRVQRTAFPNIHFLDIEGGFQFQNVNFVGGCLFFDGSMRIRENQQITPWNGWNDHLIKDIENRYSEFNFYYVDLIKTHMRHGLSTVLCTHHVPHWKLNAHAPNHYSFYCGMKDLLQELNFDRNYPNYVICGHTHRRVIGEIIPGFMCVNVGNDYKQILSYLLDI